MTPELESYIERHISPAPKNLGALERATNVQRINGRMCSGHIQGRILKMLTQLVDPRKALEIGTFTGYSALCIAEGMREGTELVTIEIEDELEESILKTFAESGEGRKITLRIGDAMEVCREFPDETFDMIFVDADKREYPEYYHECKRLLRPGGVMLADNTLWDGHVVENNRHDPQTTGIREFNRLAVEDSEMETAIIPLRDGISIIRKRTKVAT